MNNFFSIAIVGLGVLLVSATEPTSAAQSTVPQSVPSAAPANPAPASAQGGGLRMGQLPPDPKAAKAPRTIAPYFVPINTRTKAPDPEGFLQRWLLLEPINKPNRSNNVFTDSYVKKALNTEYFPEQFTGVPHNGDKVTVEGQELAWHALDATNFDVKLFNFAYGLNKQTYGVIFWAVTIVDSQREIKNVRMAVGSNSASMWWLNGEDVVNLFDDRRMVADDVVSKRLNLNKGKNVIRGAVINGPGLSDFCVRFIDENGNPIKDLTQTLP